MEKLDLHAYDYYLVSFSGGKDSTALVLHLLDLGVPKEKIELWHHLVDGAGPTLWDWEVTESYCAKFAAAFGLPIYFSWKQGGFEREMTRQDALTAPVHFETPWTKLTAPMQAGGKGGKKATRMRFPQVSADLTTRWCSAYLKIDVFDMALKNQARFQGKRTLVLSGERAEESPGRAHYAFFEPDRSDLREGKKYTRHVDRCRLIHTWKESDVWGIIQRWGVVVHPCYYLGFGRCSCKFCIFGNANQWATARALSPELFNRLAAYEREFGYTLKRNEDLATLAEKGAPYEAIHRYPDTARQALAPVYRGKIFTTDWVLPAGAYGESCGPM